MAATSMISTENFSDAPHNQSPDDLIFWSENCLPILTALIDGIGSYSASEREEQVNIFRTRVLSSLGPKPASPDDKYLMVTNNGSPVEFSVNIRDGSKPQVRFSFESIGSPRNMAEHLGADLNWFDQLALKYFPFDDLAAAAKAKLPPSLPRIPKCLAALDLVGGKTTMKAYFEPMIKTVVTGNVGNAAALESIKALEPGGSSMRAALMPIEDYQASTGSEPFQITMIAIDCKDPAAARVKIYTRFTTNAFIRVRNVITLGGRRTDDVTLRGLEFLREIWPLLSNERETSSGDEFTDKKERDPTSMHSGLMVSWDLQTNKSVPEAKLYVPLFQFCDSNRAITENLEGVFKKCGWEWGSDGRYRETIENAL